MESQVEGEIMRSKNRLLTEKIDSLVALRRETREKMKILGGAPSRGRGEKRPPGGGQNEQIEKPGPRVVSDELFEGRVQVLRRTASTSARSTATGDTADEWKSVRRRGRRRTSATRGKPPVKEKPNGGSARDIQVDRGRTNRNEGPRRRAPRSAAVTITGNADNFSYANALKNAREKVPLKELGIENVRFRVAANGGRILEIPGEGGGRRKPTS